MTTNAPHDVTLNQYPHCRKAGLIPVVVGSSYLDGFDLEDVKKALGAQYGAFSAGVKTMFSCGHKSYPIDHHDPRVAGCEILCYYAHDVEAFLSKGA